MAMVSKYYSTSCIIWKKWYWDASCRAHVSMFCLTDGALTQLEIVKSGNPGGSSVRYNFLQGYATVMYVGQTD